MAVSTAYTPLSFNGNGSTTAFAVSWPFFSGSLLVTLVSSTGVETVKTISTHYTVSGGSDADGLPATGTVTMLTAPASGEVLKIERVTPRTQPTAFTNGGAFPAKTIEAAFDKALLVTQEALADSDAGMQLISAGATDYWDAESAIIRNVADGTAANDAVNLAQLQAAQLGIAAFENQDQGALVYFDGTTWLGLAPGTSGKFLKTQGAGANPIWETIPGGGDMLAANNLSDVANAATARTNLGLAIGTNVQAYDAELAAIAGLVSAADKVAYFTGSGTAALADLPAFGRTLIANASAADARTDLGLVIGTDVQAYDAELAALAGLTSAADKVAYFTGAGTAALADLPSFGRTLIANTTAADARTDLGVIIGSDVQAYDATLASIAALGTAADKMLYTTALDTWSETDITTFARSILDDADEATFKATVNLEIGTDVQAYDADLSAIAGLSSAGFVVRTGAGTAAARTIAAGSAIALTNGDGVSGNASVALDITGLADRPAFGSGDKLVINRSGSYYKIDYDDLPGAGAGISAAYANVTDGTTTAAASGSDTFKLRVGTGMTVAVTNNDATHGDNALFSLDAELTALAGLTSAADALPYFTGSGTASTTTLTAYARSLLDDADEATFKATVNLETGVDVQAWDTLLDSLAALSDPNADRGVFWDDSAGALAWLTYGDGLGVSGTTLAAKFVQEVSTSYATYSSTTTQMPADNTIPQNTEGAEIMSVAITPKSTTNKLRIDVTVNCTSSGIIAGVIGLFQDSTANAIAAAFVSPTNAAYGMCIHLSHVMDAGTTASTTFKVRAGPGSAGTLYINGYSGGGLFGGVMKCTMTITEYTP
ncbi:MAG: phage tail fiber protein [Pseudomonadota bacterium]